jgi:hypothetical protein
MRVIKLIAAIVGTIIVFAVLVLWWTGRPPRRPSALSDSAIHFEGATVPFVFHETGYWLDCWFDEHVNVDRCKLTDVKGNALFEDAFRPCDGLPPVPKGDLVFDTRRTGNTWTGSYEKGIKVPVIYLMNGQILLPNSIYEEARKKTVDCPQNRQEGG